MLGGPQGNLPSTLTHDFSRVPHVDIQRSTFDRSHGLKTTFDAGYLIPIFYDEALPGDTFQLETHAFCRLATPIHPILDNMYIETFYFAVPFRLIWNNWEKFCGQQDNPGDSTDYLIPTTTATVVNSTLYDYFGVPNDISLTFNNLMGRAYNLCYNEWFRDENLQDSVTVDKGDGPDTASDYVLLKRGKRHDYFTSALPWPQKGDAVSIPIGTEAPVKGIGVSGTVSVYGDLSVRDTVSTRTYPHSADTQYIDVSSSDGASATPLVYADLSDAAAATINQLREAFQIQRLLEKDARGGTRYTEVIQSHFGVTSPDARLQRPEYLGGGKTRVGIDPIPQTSSTDSTTPQGNLAGFGTAGFSHNGFNKSFTEHTVIIGMACVFADLTYQQGLNRFYSKQTKYDYYWPALAHLGEQTIKNKEIYAQGTADDELTFGYQERYAEYRYKPSMVTGQMRSSFAQTLDTWHLAQDFTSLPALNASFIEENPPIDRVTAVLAAYPNMLGDFYFKLKCARPMPTYSVPGLIDHF
jgi:hypothetical protein